MASSIPEQLIAQVFALLPSGTVTAIGRRETGVHAAPNRVVAIPKGAPTIRMTDKPGDPLYVDKGRILLVREFDIDWECHGLRGDADTQDFAKAEELYLATLHACRFCWHHSVTFANEVWEDQQENADGFERFGSLITFTSTVLIPVYEARGEVVTLTATPPVDTTYTLNDTEI